MISMIIGLVGNLLAVIGWFGFRSLIALIVGTILYLIETIMEWNELNPSAKMTDLVMFGLGCLVSLFAPLPWYICGLLAINIYGLVTGLGSLIMMIAAGRRY